jgi:hypothetical protein
VAVDVTVACGLSLCHLSTMRNFCFVNWFPDDCRVWCSTIGVILPLIAPVTISTICDTVMTFRRCWAGERGEERGHSLFVVGKCEH